MSELLRLSPSHLWFFFDKFCQIPRPSKHEAALSQWIQDWATSQAISVKVDLAGNLILKKPATKPTPFTTQSLMGVKSSART